MITMPNWGKLYSQLLALVPLITVVAAVSLGSFLLYQHLSLWIHGSAYSSVYAQPHPVKIDRLKLQKGEQEITVDCVNVRAIVKSPSASTHTSHTQSSSQDSISPKALEGIPGQFQGLQSLSLIPDYPLLLARYIVRAPLSSDLVLESYLDKDGTNRIVPAEPSLQPRKQTFEMGRLREIGLWAGPLYSSLPQDVDSQQGQNWVVDLSYKQDLLRVGLVWSGLRTEGGYSNLLGWNAKIQLGIPIVRF